MLLSHYIVGRAPNSYNNYNQPQSPPSYHNNRESRLSNDYNRYNGSGRDLSSRRRYSREDSRKRSTTGTFCF